METKLSITGIGFDPPQSYVRMVGIDDGYTDNEDVIVGATIKGCASPMNPPALLHTHTHTHRLTHPLCSWQHHGQLLAQL